MAARNYIDVIEKTIHTLEALARRQGGRPLKEIARETGLVKSSAFRILYTLKELGYVEQLGDKGYYRLTLKVLPLARAATAGSTLVSVARPYMERLQKTIGESVWLAERRDDQVCLIDVVETDYPLRLSYTVGDVPPLHATALGKVMGAYMEPGELRAALRKYPPRRFTAKTLTRIPEILEHLARVREQGYAVNDEESILGAVVVGAPIFDARRRVFAAISVDAPTVRCTRAKRRRMIEKTVQSAAEISQSFADLGYDSTRVAPRRG